MPTKKIAGCTSRLPNIVFVGCLLLMSWLSIRDAKVVAWTSGGYINVATNETVNIVIVERGVPTWLEAEAYTNPDKNDSVPWGFGRVTNVNWLNCSVNLLLCYGISLIAKLGCHFFVNNTAPAAEVES